MSNYVSDGSGLSNADFILLDLVSQSVALLPVFAAGGLCDLFCRHTKLIFVCGAALSGLGMLAFAMMPNVQPPPVPDEHTISQGAWRFAIAWTIAEVGIAPIWPAIIKFITRWTSVEE
jgi:MFS family permease